MFFIFQNGSLFVFKTNFLSELQTFQDVSPIKNSVTKFSLELRFFRPTIEL